MQTTEERVIHTKKPRIAPFLAVVLMAALVVAYSTSQNVNNSNKTARELEKQYANKGMRRTLRQADFATGTVRLKQPGRYVLVEDIEFNPNPGRANEAGAWMPDFPRQAKEYDRRTYSRGFFSAITIESPGVILDLNGHWIRQSVAHNLQQRVYAHITLASSPFIPNMGPADFGTDNFVGSKDCVVKNGKLGLSSHHGIHGNNAQGCRILNMQIQDFEVAGIALNNVTKVHIENVVVKNPFRPKIRSPYGNGRFLLDFFRTIPAKKRKQKVLTFGGTRTLTAEQVFKRLWTVMDLVFRQQVHGDTTVVNDPNYSDIFENKVRVADGSSQYGIVINGIGPAVTGIGFSQSGSNNVVLQNVVVEGMVTNTREVVAVAQQLGTEQVISIGPTGEQIDVVRLSRGRPLSRAKYVGDVLSDAVLALDQFPVQALRGSTIFRISPMIRNWALFGGSLQNARMICNADSQFHVVKGVFGIRIEGTKNFMLNRVRVRDISSRGDFGSSLCGPYEHSHPEGGETLGYGGTAAYGISITKSHGQIRATSVQRVSSANGVAFGIVVWSHSTVKFLGRRTKVYDIRALSASRVPPNPVKGTNLPNLAATACGVHVRESTVALRGSRRSVLSRCVVGQRLCARRGSKFGRVSAKKCPRRGRKRSSETWPQQKTRKSFF